MHDDGASKTSGEAFARALAAASEPAAARHAIERWRSSFAPAPTPVLAPAPMPAPAHAASAPPSSAAPPAPAPSPSHVGIWKPSLIDGERWFVRDATVPGEAAQFWADVERIGPKRGTRVVLLGESCARGYPLDPLFNCAMALRGYLAAAPGAEAIEVIDLARVAMMPAALLEVLAASAALEPDIYVIFAGNNWVVGLDQADPRAIAAAAPQGCRAVGEVYAALLRSRIEMWSAEAARLVSAAGARALFVLPAENIVDYPVAGDLHNPLLPSDRQIARDAIAARLARLASEGRIAESEALAAELVAVEERCSIAGLQALGRAALARGADDQAAALFAEAREVLVCTPRFEISSYVLRTEVLRESMARLGIPTVDLPRYFRSLTGSALLGRDWFYDDCHMTARGIVAAMAPVAEALLQAAGVEAPAGGLAEVPIAVDPLAEAQAACAAALINTHDEGVMRAYAGDAIARVPEMAVVLRRYLELRLRRAPTVCSPAFHAIRAFEPRFPAFRFLARALGDEYGPNQPVDTRVTRAIAAALGAAHPEAPGRGDALLRGKFGIGEQPVEILDHAGLGAGEVLSRFIVVKPRAYVRCLHRTVRFRLLPAAARRGWRVRVTTRAGDVRAVGKQVMLMIGGEVIASWPLSASWKTISADYESLDATGTGDEAAIVWPDPEQDAAARAALLARAVEAGPARAASIADMSTVWGEIQSFQVSARLVTAVRPGAADRAAAASAITCASS